MKKALILLVSCLLVMSVQAQSDILHVAFIYGSAVGDFGWTYMHEQGRLAVAEAFPNVVETEYIENVDSANAEAVLREVIAAGNTVIFTTSFAHQDAISIVAEEFPEIIFINVAGAFAGDNVSLINGRLYQARYLSGIVAGAMSEGGLIGFVAAIPIPGVINDINAFALGVRYANPEANVQVVYANTFYDTTLESSIADSLILSGVDLMAQGTDSLQPQMVAANLGMYSISYTSDVSEIGETVLTGPVWNWGVKYVSIVEEILAGEYEAGEDYFGSIGDGIVDLAPFSPLVPEEVVEMVNERRALIEDGSWDVFCGSIEDANGVEIVEEGFCLTDDEITSMDYYVAGVIGDPAPSEAPEHIGEERE